MSIRTTLTLGVFVIATLFVGCAGPTKAGKEARSAANERMNIINAQVHYDQAKQSFETGQFQKALREINRSISRYPDGAHYHILHGRIFLETHELEAALTAFKTAVEISEEAIAKTEEVKPAEPTKGSPRPSSLVTGLAEAHYFIGIIFQRWSDDERALASYMKAFEIEPTNAQYLLAAAESLIALGEFNQARELIEARITYFEHNAALRQLQGQIALLQGDPARAAALYSEARLLNPDDPILLEQLMWAQFAAGEYGRCHESIKMLQSMRERRPVPSSASSRFQQSTSHTGPSSRTDLLHLEARCLNMMGRTTEAREIYMELTRLRPSDPVVWTELAALSWDLGDYRRVAMCSVQIIALAPDRYEGYMFKGINERHKGNLTEAAKLFQEAADRAPDLALPHLLLGQTLEQRGGGGDLPAAMVAYRQAMHAEPNSVEARELYRRLTELTPSSVLSAAPTD